MNANLMLSSMTKLCNGMTKSFVDRYLGCSAPRSADTDGISIMTRNKPADSRADSQLSAALDYRDETRARSMTVGHIIHAIVAEMLRHGRGLDKELLAECVREATSQFAPIERRAHKMRIAGCVFGYFRRLLPPEQWLFIGAEINLGNGRIDLLWTNSSDQIMIDELKTGHSPFLGAGRAEDQISRYVADGVSQWGKKFIGVRVLVPLNPQSSIFAFPDATVARLSDTPHAIEVAP